MSEQLLTILKLCLLALLYLFFMRVLWAVYAEIRSPQRRKQAAPKAEPAPRRASNGPGRLVVVEPTDRAGVGYRLAEELTVGRAAGCQITLEDSFVSQLHARVFARDGTYIVEDLGSTNGTYLNSTKVAAPMVMSQGDRLQVGNTVLELQP